MNSTDPIVIVAAKRTPIGNMLGCLSSLAAHTLGTVACQAVLEQARLQPEQVDEVILGCVLPAGQGQAPARQAAMNANIPSHVGATTINKMCGSGMKSIFFAHDMLQSGSANIILAGGMESMSQAPYLLKRARSGYRLGHDTVYDHMMLDGLEDCYDQGKSMGYFAEHTAKHYHYSRSEQDRFAQQSMQRVLQAQANGWLKDEIVSITCNDKRGAHRTTTDENPHPDKLAKIPKLKPAFDPQGTVTAANSSSISDGAAALLLMKASQAEQLSLQPLAKIVGHASYAHDPAWFTTTPSHAIRSLCDKIAWSTDEVDYYEINEAFAVVVLHTLHTLKLPLAKVNVHGGACAIGHPIGASGARIVVTLLNALTVHGKRRGIATVCIGGGEATAIAIERCG